MTLSDIAINAGPLYDTSTTYGSTTGTGMAYNHWDKNSIRMCNCDNGYFGSNCALGKIKL
jgi:hypothetical protein